MLDLRGRREYPVQLLHGTDKEAEPREGKRLSQDTQQGGGRTGARTDSSDSPGWLSRVPGLNGYHLAPGNYLSESASET